MIEITHEQKNCLKECVDDAFDAISNLKDSFMEICNESSMNEREGDDWYIHQGRYGNRVGSQGRGRVRMRDPYYY